MTIRMRKPSLVSVTTSRAGYPLPGVSGGHWSSFSFISVTLSGAAHEVSDWFLTTDFVHGSLKSQPSPLGD